jgi:signal transduction histidine kinase
MSLAGTAASAQQGRRVSLPDAAELQRFANAGRLASAVSHELLTGLGVAQTDVTFLCDLIGEGSHQRELRDAAQDARIAISRAVARISSVLSLARKRDGEVAPLDVNEVLGAALFDLDARLAGYSLVRDLEPVPCALAERGALLQTLVSLLLDAADASPPRGRIGIILRAEGGLVLLAVEDERPAAIAPEALADRTDSALWVCRSVLQSFGGELTAGFGSLGGRRVTIELRAASAPP